MADKIALGLDICVCLIPSLPRFLLMLPQFDLLLQPDLSNFLRALLNINVLHYADIRRYPDKMRLLAEYHTLVEGMEQTMGKEDDQLIWLKNQYEQVKLKLDKESQSEVDTGGVAKEDDDVTMGEEVLGEKDKKPVSPIKEDQDDSITQLWEDATEGMEGLTIESPGERDPSLPPLPSGEQSGPREQSGSREQNGKKYLTPDPSSDVRDPAERP